QITAAHQGGAKAAERLVFMLPAAGGRTRAAAKGGTRLSGNGVERDIAHGPTKGPQNGCLRLQASPEGPFERQVSVDGTGECHANPPKDLANNNFPISCAFGHGAVVPLG